jgi:hypothetical protein
MIHIAICFLIALSQKLEDMKEEMRHLRIAEKAMRMKCYESEIQLLQQQRKLAEAEEKGIAVRKKSRKKKVKRRRRSADGVRDGGQGEGEGDEEEEDSDQHLEEANGKRSEDREVKLNRRSSSTEKKPKRRPLSAGHVRRPPGAARKQEKVIDVLDLVLSPGGRSDQGQAGGGTGGVSKKKSKAGANKRRDVHASGVVCDDGDGDEIRLRDRERDRESVDRRGGLGGSSRDRNRRKKDCAYDDDEEDKEEGKHNDRSHYNDAKMGSDNAVDDRFDFDLDEDDDDEYEEYGSRSAGVKGRQTGVRGGGPDHTQDRQDRSRSDYMFENDKDDGSAQSSEIFAHRIKELTDREDVIARRQHERRHTHSHSQNRPVGGSVSTGGSSGYSGSGYGSSAVSGARSSRHNDDDDEYTVGSSSAASATDGTYISNITDRTPYAVSSASAGLVSGRDMDAYSSNRYDQRQYDIAHVNNFFQSCAQYV